MARHRHSTLIAVATANFVFGILGLLWGAACGVGGVCVGCVGMLGEVTVSSKQNQRRDWEGLSPPSVGIGDPVRGAEKAYQSIPGFIPYLVFSEGMGLGMSILLIAAGVGLLLVRPWARVASIVYGIYSVPASIGSLIYIVSVLNPAIRRVTGSEAPLLGMGKSDLVALAWHGLNILFAGSLLIVMFLPHVRAALARRGPK